MAGRVKTAISINYRSIQKQHLIICNINEMRFTMKNNFIKLYAKCKSSRQ